MFVSKPRKVSLTLFCYLALVLALATVAQADSLNQPVARDHVQLNRMLRKRAFPDILGTNGAAGDPPKFDGSSSSAAASSTSAASSAAQSQASSASSASSTSASASQTSASSSSASASSAASSGSSSAASSSGSSSSTSSAQSTSSQPTDTPAQPTNTNNTPAQPTDTSNTDNSDDNSDAASSKSLSRVTHTVTSQSGPTDSAAALTSGASASMPKAATTVLIVIASCVGAVVIGWTIIRKWKFRKSSHFDERMQPIDWQPADDGALQRNASVASHGSFRSAGHSDESFSGRGAAPAAYGASPLQPIPDHDFTAGATTLAPVGGYADLARGPSPGPQMAELQRGPSVGHAAYGMHPQYDYNNGRY